MNICAMKFIFNFIHGPTNQLNAKYIYFGRKVSIQKKNKFKVEYDKWCDRSQASLLGCRFDNSNL